MNLDVRNVLLYVDDAVRYNALADELCSLGPTHETIAASTHTPTSFGSMHTGLHPAANGVLSFEHHPAPSVRSVFDIERPETTMAATGGMNHSLARMFEDPPRKTIEELEPPFIHVVRRPGGHAPYNGFEWQEYEYRNETAREYLYRVADDPQRARRDYYRGVKTSFEEFERVLAVLEQRDLAEETLVIYTSDHGELLGEYGFFGHTHLATPEIVYIPTTFIHPSLSPERASSLLHHVDLLPTIEAVSEDEIDIGRTHGTAFGENRTRGYNHFEHVHYGTMPRTLRAVGDFFGGFERTVRSLWDRSGGHVFTSGSTVTSSIVYLGLLSRTPEGRQILRNHRVRALYSRFVPGHRSYRSPGFTQEEALAEIGTLATDVDTPNTERLDDDAVERLRDLGYM